MTIERLSIPRGYLRDVLYTLNTGRRPTVRTFVRCSVKCGECAQCVEMGRSGEMTTLEVSL